MARKAAAARRSVRVSEVPTEDDKKLDATVAQAVEATHKVQAIINKTGKRSNDSSSISSSVASHRGEPRG